jgi:hypothetical protein
MARHRSRRRETLQRYEEKHGARDRATKRQRYAEDMADPEKAAAKREYDRKYYRDNRERLLERARQQRERNQLSVKRSQHGTDWGPLFEALWEAQDGCCYLCGDPLQRDADRAIHLDHSHECCPLGKSCERCRRGLACKECNLIIGIAKDDPDRLLRMSVNLRLANEGVRERMLLPRQPVEPKSYELNCLECGQRFAAYRSDHLCCSTACYERMRRRQREEARNAGVGDRACEECGAVFVARSRYHKYCSDPCAQRAASRRRRAQHNGQALF